MPQIVTALRMSPADRPAQLRVLQAAPYACRRTLPGRAASGRYAGKGQSGPHRYVRPMLPVFCSLIRRSFFEHRGSALPMLRHACSRSHGHGRFWSTATFGVAGPNQAATWLVGYTQCGAVATRSTSGRRWSGLRRFGCASRARLAGHAVCYGPAPEPRKPFRRPIEPASDQCLHLCCVTLSPSCSLPGGPPAGGPATGAGLLADPSPPSAGCPIGPRVSSRPTVRQ